MKTFKEFLNEQSQPHQKFDEIPVDGHSWDSDRPPAAPHNNNLKMLTKRIGEHKKANDGFVHSHKLLHTYATNAKHATKGHIEDLKRRGPFGVSDYRGDRAVTSVMKYNHQLRSFNKSPHEYEKAAKEHLSKIADED